MSRKRGGVLLVPYVGIYPEAVVEPLDAARIYNWSLVVEPLGPEVDAYRHKLHELWTLCARAKTDLMVVEHDVVVHHDVFEAFDECANDYCVFPYWLGASYGYGLGCTRFRAALIMEHPDLIAVAGQRSNDGLPVADHWKRMDTRIRDEARERGLLPTLVHGEPSPCVHEPPVRHLHTYPMAEPIGMNEHEAGMQLRDRLAGG